VKDGRILVAAAATTVSAAAAATAASLGHFIFRRYATEFDGGADVFADFLLKTFQLALGLEETGGDFVFEESFAGSFEFRDFCFAQFHTSVLLVVEFFTALMHALILKTGSIVVEETLNVGLVLDECWVAGDFRAEFPCFFEDGRAFGNSGHVRS